jgi:hypothetical protein
MLKPGLKSWVLLAISCVVVPLLILLSWPV